MSKVLEQIPDVVENHRNYKRTVKDYQNETKFRFILHHNDDKNRELTLTVLVFEVPTYIMPKFTRQNGEEPVELETDFELLMKK